MATIAELIGLASLEANVEETRLSFVVRGSAMVLGRDGKLRDSGAIGTWDDERNLIVSAVRLHAPGDVIGTLVRKNGSTEPIVHERQVLALDGGSIIFVDAFEADDESGATDEPK